MRVCRLIATGRIIEAQSGDGAPLESLRENARAAGHDPLDLDLLVMDDRSYAEAIAAQNAADRPARWIDPSAIVSRLGPHAAAIKAAIEADAQMWFLWQRLSGRAKPIDILDPEFGGAWRVLAGVIGADAAARILAEIEAEASP